MKIRSIAKFGSIIRTNRRYAAFAVVLFALGWLAAGGMTTTETWLTGFQETRRTRALLESEWGDLASGASMVGEGGGPVVLVEFADYECPYCRVAGRTLDSLTGQTGAMIAYRHLPIRGLHPAAEGAARSAICAGVQGRFPEMHRYLNSRVDWQQDSQWTIIAGRVGGIDTSAFAACLPAQTTSNRLREDSMFAARLGVRGTPTFFSRTGRYVGALSAVELEGLASGAR